MTGWVNVCRLDEIEPEDVIRFDHGARTFAVYRAENGDVYATDGLCTHEQVHLADGLVMGDTIECPMHNGRFNYCSGAALRAPAYDPLATYPTRVVDGLIQIGIG